MIFFFKQKTAYEMRISDWSTDVCSSDLVRAVDVQHSRWDCHLERDAQGRAAIRLGLRLVRGFNIEAGHRIVQARLQEAFVNIDDLSRRAALDARELERLAGADALQALAGHRFQARWQTRGHARLDGVLANTEQIGRANVCTPVTNAH